MSKTEISLVYITFADKEKALESARTLLEEKLIACANILENSTSVYRWEDKLKSEMETIMLAKTSTAKTDSIIARIKELHSYEVPCIMVLPVDKALPEFINWVKVEVYGKN